MADFEQTAFDLSLSFDGDLKLAFGRKNGYYLAIKGLQKKVFTLMTALSQKGQLPDQEALKVFVNDSSYFTGVTVKGYSVFFNLKGRLTQSKTLETFQEAIDELTSFLARSGYQPACQVTGSEPTAIYSIANSVVFVSDEGLRQLTAQMSEKQLAHDNTKEQFIPGIIGALLGSLVGVAMIVIIGQLGYVSVVSGLIMGAATIKGYEFLGKKLTKKGIVATVLITLGMTYFAFRLDWALTVARFLSVSWLDGYQILPHLLESGDIDRTDYYIEMAKLLGFTLLGFIPSLLSSIATAKSAFDMRKLY